MIPIEELDDTLGAQGGIPLEELDEALGAPASTGLAGGINQVVGAPARVLRSALGAPEAEALTDEQAAQVIGSVGETGLHIPSTLGTAGARAAMEHPLGRAAVRPAAEFLYGTATDPLTLAPMGALTKLGKVGHPALKALTGAFTALQAAGAYDALKGLTGAIEDAAGKGELTPEVVQGLVNSALSVGGTALGGLAYASMPWKGAPPKGPLTPPPQPELVGAKGEPGAPEFVPVAPGAQRGAQGWLDVREQPTPVLPVPPGEQGRLWGDVRPSPLTPPPEPAAPYRGPSTQLDLFPEGPELRAFPPAEMPGSQGRLGLTSAPIETPPMEIGVGQLDLGITPRSSSALVSTPEGVRVAAKMDEARAAKIIQREYGSGSILTPIRELIQNASDSIQRRMTNDPALEGKIDLDVDTGTHIITIKDNGAGIPEDILTGAFVDPFRESPHKELGSAGGLSAGKHSYFGIADRFKVKTTTEGGKAYEWEFDPADLQADPATISPPKETAPGEIGTEIEIHYKDGVGEWDVGAMDSAYNWVKRALSGYQRPELVNVKYDGIPLREGYLDVPVGSMQQVDAIDLPDATVNVYAHPDTTVGKRQLGYGLANNGLPQVFSNLDVPQDLPVPKGLLFDVRPKVGAGDPTYPWAMDRNSVSGPVRDAVRQYLGDNILGRALAARDAKYAAVFDSAVEIPGTPYRVLDPTTASGRLAQQLANQPVVQQVVSKIGGLVDQLIMAEGLPGQFFGMALSGDLGTTFSTNGMPLGKPLRGTPVVVNWHEALTAGKAAASAGSGKVSRLDVLQSTIDWMWHTIAHEVAHVGIDGGVVPHDTEHSYRTGKIANAYPGVKRKFGVELLKFFREGNYENYNQLDKLRLEIQSAVAAGKDVLGPVATSAKAGTSLPPTVASLPGGGRIGRAGLASAVREGRARGQEAGVGSAPPIGDPRSAPTTTAAVRDLVRSGQLGKEWLETTKSGPLPEPPLKYMQGGLGMVGGDLGKMFKQLAESPVGAAINAWRTLASSYDLSAVGRQGKVAVIRHPGLARDALGTSLKSLVSQGKYAEAAKALKSHRAYQRAKSAGLDLTDPNSATTAEEAFMGKELVEWMPGVKGSERAYTAFLNKLRLDVFDLQLGRLAKWNKGRSVDPKVQKALAQWVNVTTGRGSLGQLSGAARTLNTLLWSPKFLASRIALLNPLTYYKPKLMKRAPGLGLYQIDPKLARIALEDLGAFTAFNGTLLYLFAQAGGEVETDPHSSDFMKAKHGRTRLDLWAGLQPLVRYTTQVVDGVAKSTTTGKHYEVSPFETLGRFAWTKTSPLVSAAIAAKLGHTVGGEPVDVLKGEGLGEILNPLPLTTKDIYDAWQEDPTMAIPLGIAMIMGESVQTYDKRARRPMQKHRKEKPRTLFP